MQLQTIADDWVLIEVEAQQRDVKSEGGIVLPNAMQNVSFGIVKMVGRAKPFPGTAERPETPAQPGDRILFQDLRAIPQHIVTFENRQYRLIRHHDVLGVVEPALHSDEGEETEGVPL